MSSLPEMCDYCADWSSRQVVCMVFPSEQAFASSRYYNGGDSIKGDDYAEVAVWPGKTNANRHYDDWWICTPVHPNCSHSYKPFDPVDVDEYDFKSIFDDVDAEIRSEQDQAYSDYRQKSSLPFSPVHKTGVWHSETCACNHELVETNKTSWVREYLARRRLDVVK